jgi:nitrogen regulatory protein PII 2
MIIIRHEKYRETRKELEDAGFVSYSSHDVLGRGNIGSSPEVKNKTDDKDTRGSLLYSRKMIEICVTDRDVDQAVDIISRVNRDGHHGNGKIFVLPVKDAHRVRTAEKGDEAIM